MTDTFRIAPRPQMRERQGNRREVVAAQPGNYLGALPQGNQELEGLVRGLAAFNPALGALAQQRASEEHRAADLAGRAAAQLPEAPREALTGAPVEAPTTVPPAYGEVFQSAVREGLSHRAALANKTAAVTEYNNLKDTEGFNPQAWLVEKRQEALKGITDPASIDIVGRHFGELEAQLSAEMERERIVKREAAVNSTLLAQAGDMFTGNMTGEQLADNYQQFLQRARASGKTGKEASQYLLMQLQHVSNRMGGAPELFDVFDYTDTDGTKIGLHLTPQIDAARRLAKETRDKGLMESTEKARASTLGGYESDIDTAPEKVTMDRILADMTQFGAVQSPAQAASLWARAQEQVRKRAATGQLMGYFDSGELWRLEPSQQNKIMDAKMGGLIEQLSQANRAGDSGSVAGIAAQILQAHTNAKPTVPFDQLKGYLKTLVSTAPSPEGPSAAFQAGAAIYKAMAKAPQYRDLYFDEDTRKVLDGYIAETDNGTDPKAAHVQAYQAVSPEAKAAADAYAKTPEFQKLVQADAKKYVTGSSWVPKWMGGNGRPANVPVVGAALASALREHRARNPFVSDEQMEEFAEGWTAKNFVLDSTTNSAIRVPPALGGPAAQEALSSFSKKVSDTLKLGSRNDGDWTVQYIPLGAEGQYSVVAFNGAASQPVGNVNLQTLLDNERARKVFSPDELATLGRAKKAIAAGTYEPLSMELLAKAEALKAFTPSEMRVYRDASDKAFIQRMNEVPKVSFGSPSFDNLQHVPSKPGKVDHKLTGSTALELLSTPMLASHQTTAASLITLGEGVVLQAYDDPASGAGKNIGMGYNLKANAGRVHADLKQAGVPAERIQDVVDGKAALTPEQAKRLLMVALPRYEKQVQEVAESSSPGLWSKMTAAQKAVMIDVAWQTGDPAQFKKAWGSLVAGDNAAFTEQTKVHYTDRSGTRREDTRRNALRASMLAGLGHWQATVEKYGSLPSSKLQALAFNSN